MSLLTQYLFRILAEKNDSTPNATPTSGDTSARTSVHILGFSTSNYDAMIKFFRDFGFTVAENPYGDQLVPFFESGRAARVRRGDFEFQLEESEAVGARAYFNLFLTDFTDADIEKIKTLGYTCHYESFGNTHTFRTPDGGTVVL